VSPKYHPGEIEVQERAGVRPMAELVGKSIHSTIPQAAREFLEEQLMVVVGSVDADGRVWASLLVGEPGFVRVLDERTVRIDATSLPGDPLEEVLQGAGALAIDLPTRRLLRLSSEAEAPRRHLRAQLPSLRQLPQIHPDLCATDQRR
jgi:uncharacterized protein